jgi:hypothetical protein
VICLATVASSDWDRIHCYRAHNALSAEISSGPSFVAGRLSPVFHGREPSFGSADSDGASSASAFAESSSSGGTQGLREQSQRRPQAAPKGNAGRK